MTHSVAEIQQATFTNTTQAGNHTNNAGITALDFLRFPLSNIIIQFLIYFSYNDTHYHTNLPRK